MGDIFDDVRTRPAPTRGRRAEVRKTEETVDHSTSPHPDLRTFPVESAVSQISLGEDDVVQLPTPERPSRRSEIWRVEQEQNNEDERLIHIANDSEDDIPIIPDLDQLNNESILDEIAAPPITTLFKELLLYTELDSDLMKRTSFQILDNEIDLKVLTKCLVSEKDTIELDETWQMSSLFTEMHSFVTCCNKNILKFEYGSVVENSDTVF